MRMRLLAGLLSGSFVLPAPAAGAYGAAVSAAAPVTMPAQAQTEVLPRRAESAQDWQARHGLYYKRNWGVEIIGVKPVSSGYMLAFRYRIVDPEKAKLLNDRNAKAYLIDEATGIRLAVPALENVGELRPDAKPQRERTYFMMFGNPGKVVKSGSVVNLVVGNLRVEGLLVD